MVIAVVILDLFMPRIKGFFGEKSVSFFLSRLDETKYMVINDIMLQVGSKATQIDHVVLSNYKLQKIVANHLRHGYYFCLSISNATNFKGAIKKKLE